MVAAVRRHGVDVVVVTTLDRRVRSTRHLVTVAADLALLGVDLVRLDQAIDTPEDRG